MFDQNSIYSTRDLADEKRKGLLSLVGGIVCIIVVIMNIENRLFNGIFVFMFIIGLILLYYGYHFLKISKSCLNILFTENSLVLEKIGGKNDYKRIDLPWKEIKDVSGGEITKKKFTNYGGFHKYEVKIGYALCINYPRSFEFLPDFDLECIKLDQVTKDLFYQEKCYEQVKKQWAKEKEKLGY